MFTFDICRQKGCSKPAVSLIETAGGERNGELPIAPYCFEHCENQQELQQSIREYIDSHDKIVGLSAADMQFASDDFSGKHFYGCNFQNCTFTGIHSENCRIRMCICDVSVFADCNLIKSNIQFSSFAGAVFSHAIFTDSDLIHNNFNGVSALQSSFDDSDLYNSRFINARLVQTSFRNCNIKKTCFYEAEQTDVSFKLSNTREALFSPEQKEDIFCNGDKL